MTNKMDTEVALQGGAIGYVGVKLFGKTLSTMGDDLNNLYKLGRDKIIDKCAKKIDNIDDGKSTNLRVTRDVFWNGSFSEEEIVAEYFAGILAGSRSDDGKNDQGIFYLDIIKSLSSKQLHLHYIIYNSFKKLLDNGRIDRSKINVGLGKSVNVVKIHFDRFEIDKLGIDETQDCTAIYNKGLIHSWSGTGVDLNVGLTTLGILLYLQAYNKLNETENFSKISCKLEDFDNINLPKVISNIKVEK